MEWWKTLFNEDYLATYADTTNDEMTRRQADFVRPFLGQCNLDLACGQGRHTNMLTKDGHFVVGLDYSRVLLDAANRNGDGLFLHGDMRDLPFADESFDSVFCLMSSFGYFVDETDHQKVADEVRRVLKDGGVFILDLKSPHFNHEGERTDTLSNGLTVKTTDQKDGNRWKTTREWDGKKYESSMRVFSEQEARELLRDFTVEVYGSYAGTPFTEESKRMLLVARK